ncbi:alkane hydroxylase MAH1-like [Chenopodium quinoa]|uniref:alkane hydroxylase MAH1-like n=1 Tax=Chenopodium quinoa TaxID=63459 RepID=UPI000B782E91|nr:alkane hydroxylase MAH1-like [Chenopodium quinoa]
MGYYMLINTLILLFFALFCFIFRNKNGLPTKWPLVGMLPALLKNVHNTNAFVFHLMENSNMNFHFIGPWFANMHILVTVDPANLNHIYCKKSGIYVKGSKYNEIFDVLGDGILNSDSDVWSYHRNVAHLFFHHPQFHHSLIYITWEKVKNGLIPFLDHVAKHSIEIDLQNIFLRFMYDTMSKIMMDHDPESLSIDLPDFPLLKAVADLEHTIFTRHVLPTCIWKFQRWLNIEGENKYKQAWKILDDFIYKCINKKREEMRKATSKPKDNEIEVSRVDLLTLFIDSDENTIRSKSHNDKFLRDTVSNFYLAGGETTSIGLTWFFFLLLKNPQIAHKIKMELDGIMIQVNNNYDRFLSNFIEFSGQLIHLHATLCESLRLYPVLTSNHKSPIEPDILSSGHQVNPNTEIIINAYVMGRMKSIWGEDCNEFKPERWITEGGTIKREPSYKFAVFSAGPRSCMGKQMVFTQMKIIAAFIIQHYNIETVQGYYPVLDHSILLRLKNGFKVKISRSQN